MMKNLVFFKSCVHPKNREYSDSKQVNLEANLIIKNILIYCIKV